MPDIMTTPEATSAKASSSPNVLEWILLILLVLNIAGVGMLYLGMQQTTQHVAAVKSVLAGYGDAMTDIGTAVQRIETAQSEMSETPTQPIGIEVQASGGATVIYPRAADWSSGAEVKDPETGSLYVKSPDGKFYPEGTDQGERPEVVPE